MNLEQLERLEREATPGPVRVSIGHGCEVVDGVGEWLAEFERAEDAEHYAAARNALPALLRVAKAAQRTAAAYAAWDAYIEDESEDEERADVLIDMSNEAKAELFAALKALEGEVK